MLEFIKHNKGVISWLLSQIALLLSAGILIAAIASLTFYSDWQKEAEAKAIALQIARYIETIDLETMPKNISILLPKNYQVSLSTDYVIVEAEGKIKKKIVVTHPLIIKPYAGISGKELHQLLKKNYGFSGRENETIPSGKYNEIKKELEKEMEKIAKTLTLNPMVVNTKIPLIIEKTIFYFEDRQIEIITIYQERYDENN